LLVLTAKTENLRGFVIQPPDASKIDDRLWAGHQFPTNDLVELDSTTLLLELIQGMEAIKRGMRKTVREAIRQSERRAIRAREGGEQDIGTFFALLVANCRGQQKKPRPATEANLLQVRKESRERNAQPMRKTRIYLRRRPHTSIEHITARSIENRRALKTAAQFVTTVAG
jgi:hypothetical protein